MPTLRLSIILSVVTFVPMLASTHITPIAETTYSVNSPYGNWIVTPIGTSGENVWVAIDVEPGFLTECNTGSCPRVYSRLTVSPCPLEARIVRAGYDPIDVDIPCGGTAATLVYLGPEDDSPFELLLAPGDYLFSGDSNVVTFQLDMSGPCGQDHCRFDGIYGPTTFSTSTLPVTPTTWGRVKAMYRG